jgi:hypothetical protein
MVVIELALWVAAVAAALVWFSNRRQASKPADFEMCQDCWSWKRVGRSCQECEWSE